MNRGQKSASYPKQRGKLVLAITLLSALLVGTVFAGLGSPRPVTAQGDNPNPSGQVAKLIFIWLADYPYNNVAVFDFHSFQSDALCPPLPAPTGDVVHVSTVAELQDAVSNLTPNTTILLADGTYDLHGAFLWFGVPGVTMRSASGNREAVVIDGNYETTEIVVVAASDVTIADLTLKRAMYHPIHVIATDDADTENTLIYNVHIMDPGQQAIKINQNSAMTHFPDYGVIACSHVELTDEGRPRVWEINDSCYTGGVDGHQARGWVIRDNVIEGFWCEHDLAEHGIHFWTGSRDTVVERNTLIDNARGVGLGLGQSGNQRVYDDNPCPGADYVGHFGGVIRNNFVFASRDALFSSESSFDCGICLEQACGTQVLHNTVASTGALFSSIEWRWPNTNVEITNNLVSHNLRERDGAIASLAGNLENAPLSLFVDGAGGDLHLAASASAAIDQGVVLAAGLCGDDVDSGPRPMGPAPDVGADEYGALPPAVTEPTASPTAPSAPPTPTPTTEEPAVETPVAEEPAQLALPPAGHIYHAVYPGEAIADSKPPPDGIPFEEDGVSLDDLRSYEQHVGKTAAWVYFSHNWFRERSFPLSTASWIRDAGSIPYIRLMLRSSSEQNVAEPTFTLDRIISGDFDDDLRAWARDARDFGSPLIVEYGTEVNGEWFAWNGSWNGAGTLDGYGDPAEYDGPERFRDAYRHIIQIAREEGGSNITWVFHADAHDIPDEAWNRLELYYPGDEWIDWLGVSVYGALDPMDDEWLQFRDVMEAVYPRLAALSPDKPIALLEFGVASGNPLGDQAEWAEAALTDLVALRWPRLIGFSWWNEKWENDDDPDHDSILRVQDNPDLAAVFQRLVGSEPQVLGRVYQAAAPLAPATEEPMVEEPAAEEPSAEASLVDDFEGTYEPDQGWEAWADEQTDTSLAFTLDNEVAYGGSTSLRIEFDIAPGSWADFGRSFDPAQDWSDGTGLSMWLRFGEDTGGDQEMSVILDSGEPENSTPFETWFEISPESADPSGWILVELPWDHFTKPDWASEGDLSELDPSRVTGIALSFGAPNDSRAESTVWVDDIRLLGEAPQPAPTEAAPAAPATPTEAPVAVAPTPPPPAPTAPPEEEDEGGGLCPISVGLALTGLAFARKRGKARPE